MKDIFGTTLAVGDYVAAHFGGRASNLQRAQVIGFTAKMVKVKYPHGTTGVKASYLLCKSEKQDYSDFKIPDVLGLNVSDASRLFFGPSRVVEEDNRVYPVFSKKGLTYLNFVVKGGVITNAYYDL